MATILESTRLRSGAPVARLDVSVYRIPTDLPESDGTFEWDATTMILVEIEAANVQGIGFTYGDTATATLIRDRFHELIINRDALNIEAIWASLFGSVRNAGRPGIASTAISAVDNALWDLKARLLNLPLVRLLGQVRDRIPVYGSGGFTSYSIAQLQRQLAGWANDGIASVKMKVGRDPRADAHRVAAARETIGPATQLFVDANGAYQIRQAVALAAEFAKSDVTWFEEPVSSDDLKGLRFVRDHAPARMQIAAGEYGFDQYSFRAMLEAQCVDVLMVDATRCCGITGFLKAATLADAFFVPVSSHCAPAMHLHLDCALRRILHLEYFHDHARIEEMFFDGFHRPQDGFMSPDLSRPGHGIELRRAEAARYRVE